MTRGLSRDQIGITEEMIQTYGDRVWELSHNLQVRRGDPVRELDWAQIEAQRDGRGMADVEIADEIGLTRNQVLYIRLILESRRFRRDHYHRLYDLGGGRRFRHERFVPHEDRSGFSAEAIRLRTALKFDPATSGRYLRLGLWTSDTVPRWLDERAREHADRPAISSPSGTLTYAEARARALRLANALLGLGLCRGDVVAVRLANVPEFILSYLGITTMGGVMCALPPALSDDGAWALMRTVSARAVIRDASQSMPDPGADDETAVHDIVVSGACPAGSLSFAALLEDAPASAIEAPPVASDPALLCLSGGRAVLHNYHTMLSNCRAIASIYGLEPGEVVMTSLPFSDALGLGAVNLALNAGAPIHMPADDTHEAWATALAAAKPSAVLASASQLAAGLFGATETSSVRKAAIYGGECTEDDLRALDRSLANGSVARLWGGAECFTALHTPFDAPETVRLKSVGGALAGIEARVVSATGEASAPGQRGELEVRGSPVFTGYVGDDGGDPFGADGWFRSGKNVTMDPDGNFRLESSKR